MGLGGKVAADFVTTVLWAAIISTTGYLITLLTPLHKGDDTVEVALVLGIAVCQIVLFALVAEALGGASFNPLANIANFVAGEGDETLPSLIARLPAQTVGMQAGAWLTWHYLVPHTHRHTLEGPGLKPGVDLVEGAAAEFALVFLLNTLVLYVLFGRPSSAAQKALILVPATLLAIVAGAGFTGPSMNPLFAFSWAYHHNRHSSLEHFLVYWLAPISGAVMAGLAYRLFLKPRKVEMKILEKKTE